VKFTDLKTRMVDQGMSLGQALQDVKKTPTSALK
jgi:pilus assembly protein TadC